MDRVMGVCRRSTWTMLTVIWLVVAGCVDGTAVEEVGAPGPFDECRELGGGWQWRGTRGSGAHAVGHRKDLDAAEARADGTIRGSSLDDDELRESVAGREAAGWTEERLMYLSVIDFDVESAIRLSDFEGTREEFERHRRDIVEMLDAAPECQA